MKKSDAGMTLIEVLIASVILFIAIAAVSMVSRTNTLYKQRLNIAINESLAIDSIMDEISFYLEYSANTQGVIVATTSDYTWEASLLTKKAIASSIGLNTQEIVADRGFFYLYEISIVSSASKNRIRLFEKVIWRAT